jgi:hypothetical protein
MKFAQNKLYIESYDKCPNCGLLLYEKPANVEDTAVLHDGRKYCSQWCVDWERERAARRSRPAA